MKCKACGCSDRWEVEYYPVTGHPNIETKFLICECGNEYEINTI